MAVQHCIMSTDEEAAELEAEKLRTGLSKTDILLSRATQSGAWRASRTRSDPITASTVAAEEENKRRFWMGDPSCPDTLSMFDFVLEEMGIVNRDQRAEMFAEQALRRPDVVTAAYTLHQSNLDAVPLVRAAFEEWRAEEPEAFLETFSKSDLTKLLLSEGTTFDAALATNANNPGQLLEMHAGEAERSDPARMRAHARRVLRAWREAGIEWPQIQVDKNGAPHFSDGTRVEFSYVDGRRQPRLVAAPHSAPEAEVHSVSPTPRPGQIGGSAEVARDLALAKQTSAKIGTEPK